MCVIQTHCFVFHKLAFFTASPSKSTIVNAILFGVNKSVNIKYHRSGSDLGIYKGVGVEVEVDNKKVNLRRLN